MKRPSNETLRRRKLQVEYNEAHGIRPETIKKAIRSTLESEMKARPPRVQEAIHADDQQLDQTEIVKLLEEEMLQAAQNLEFERAAQLRDKINEMKGAPTIRSGVGAAIGPDPKAKRTARRSGGRSSKVAPARGGAWRSDAAAF